MSRTAPAILILSLLGLVGGRAATADVDEWTPLDRFFRGRITALDRGVVTIHYDFSTKVQLEDWYESLPFPVRRLEDQGVEWKEESISIRGNTGVRHVAEWSGDVQVRCRLVPEVVKDFGGLLAPGDDSKDYATFTLAEHFFHRWDNDTGGQHTILKFGKKFKKRGFGADFTGFRYVARRPPPKELIPGRPVTLTFGLQRGKLFLDVHKLELKGKDIGVKLKAFQPGFYVLGGGLRVDDVEIKGELEPKWLRGVAVALILEKPLEEDDR